MKNNCLNAVLFTSVYFAFCSTIVAFFLIQKSPTFWTLMLNLFVSVIVASTASWLVVCRNFRKVTALRSIVVGTLAGLLVVPLFWFCGELIHGSFIGIIDVLSATLFFSVVFVLTVPLGVLSVVTSRWLSHQMEIRTRKASSDFRGSNAESTSSENPYDPPRQ